MLKYWIFLKNIIMTFIIKSVFTEKTRKRQRKYKRDSNPTSKRSEEQCMIWNTLHEIKDTLDIAEEQWTWAYKKRY